MKRVCVHSGGSWPGVARRQVSFFVSPKKETKERRPRCATPAGRASTAPACRGVCATRPGGPHTTRPTPELGQCSPFFPVNRAPSRWHRGGANPRCALPPLQRPRWTGQKPEKAGRMSEPAGRVSGPPGFRNGQRGKPKARKGGVPFFWFLFLGKQEKELAAGQPPANRPQITRTPAANPPVPAPSNN